MRTSLASLCHLLFAALLLAGCSAADMINATIPRAGYSIEQHIAYGSAPRQRLDLYLPATRAASRCAILFVYGGSWQNGNRGDYAFAGQALSETGCIVAIPDYRIHPEVTFPAFVNDTALALDWLHRHADAYGASNDRLFIVGHSAGAYNGMMAMLYPDTRALAQEALLDVKGFVGLSGPYDFLPFTDDDIKAVFAGVPATDTQPITHARDITAPLPPMLLITGDNDTTVFPRNSHNLAQVLRTRNYQVTVKEYDGAGHIATALSLARGFRHLSPALADIKVFITAHSPRGKDQENTPAAP